MAGYADKISEAVIHRLPKYYRYLTELEKEGEAKVSSARMSRDMGLNASQIRRDLNCFGGFGQQGYGYSVAKLKNEIADILGINKKYKMVIVGAGNFGHALLSYKSFADQGFEILGMFDNDPTKIDGETVFDIAELESFVEQAGGVEIGVVCTPKSAAKAVSERLAACGVKGIWNFAPEDVIIPGVSVENVHLNDGLYVLCFRLNADRYSV